MLKYLPSDYLELLTGQKPKKPSAHDLQTGYARLLPFGLEHLEDKNEVVELPIPDGFGSIDQELDRAFEPFDSRWCQIESLVNTEPPPFPDHFFCRYGWSLWDGSDWQPVADFPSGKTFVLDAETVKIREGIWHPTCMVAMSERGWLVWRADLGKVEEVPVVPFGSGNNVLGYNISYDRSYLDVEYRLEESGNQFYDLMSQWIVTNGMSNQQRLVYKKFTKDEDGDSTDKPVWLQKTASNGLAEAYKFYTGKQLDKGVREGIVDLGLEWVRENMPEVIRYCALDVKATHELAGHLLPAYKRHRPSKINRYGSVALGSCWVPLSVDRYPSYYERVESVYQASKAELNDLLMQAATDYLERYNGQPQPQTESLDWTVARSGIGKGQPAWYRKCVSDYKLYKKLTANYGYAEKGGLTLSQRWAPLVLEMAWDKEPILWDDMAKGFYTAKHGLLPHPTDRGQPVANMFLKDFAALHESGFISVPEAVKPLAAKKTTSINWVSTRKRVASIRTESPDGYPVTIPMLSPNGTVTGRATDAIWQVLPNPKESRIGTELKSMVAPFPGYSFVGADVDSQEAWLAACHGDEDLGFCGSTPFGLMTIVGTKEDGTDIHSVLARQTSKSRDTTKTRVYGSLYGQGIKGDSDVLLKADPSLSEAEANSASKQFIHLLKGRKEYGTSDYRQGMASAAFTQMERLADKRHPVTPLTGACMSGSLAGVKDYKPTRVNWIVQASGVDFRDMLVLLTKSFYRRLGVKGRLILTIHDEIRTMVHDEDVTRAIYALQLAHLYTRVAFIQAHRLDDIPASIAGFSAVDVDRICLRKDPYDPQITPTQDALPKGYTVNPQQLLDLLNGSNTNSLQKV